ncbi:serine O-acetyltransferase [Neoasaia chiangmaiensis NBRC 101099]|uniref:Serine acetyltransferase n=1 Tax=Neoasaia chiangmaiensis TaxID=320497 RepID=A0A1U9KRU4_9PROT|nr:serine O-acetyltransferase [Neoasaia chiangmaiensis]AQS88518.1 serine acetyltransferase [Neoasaia chiangmaiensis]GBR36428.1 serine O-acetyltransferase [Neoasaia chiangmaiensis NBRC 101099]GEN15348.1 serine O-acetyltransferase [Neoasaia chiangmaiensis]
MSETTPVNLDAVWREMLVQSDVCCDVLIQGVFATGISEHRSFQSALSALLGTKLADRAISAPALSALVASALLDTPAIAEAACEDMIAIFERDAACPDYVTPFLFFKGFHAIQAHRIAHWLWGHDRRHLARHLQSLVSERFGVDIHPAAQLGRRLVFDHGTGIVIGETCVVEDDVSMLQGVTLGGTGKSVGDRHPKVRRGVLVGAGAKVLGNIELGEGAKIGAGSVVLESVPPYTTVVGNPARRIGTRHTSLPALGMDQRLPPVDYAI